MSYRELARALGVAKSTVTKYVRRGIPREDLLAAQEWVRLFRRPTGRPKGSGTKPPSGGAKESRKNRNSAKPKAGPTRKCMARALGIGTSTLDCYLLDGMPSDDLSAAAEWISERKRQKQLGVERRRADLKAVPMQRGKTYPHSTPSEILDAIADVKDGNNVSTSLGFLAEKHRGIAYTVASDYMEPSQVREFLNCEFLRLLRRAALRYDPNKVHFVGCLRTNVIWESIRWIKYSARDDSLVPFPDDFDPPAEPPIEFPVIHELGERYAALPRHHREFLAGFMSADSDVGTFSNQLGWTEAAVEARLEEIRYRLERETA
jgi:hypothetical protein